MVYGLPPPPNYLLFNAQNTKKLAVVVDIDGLDYLTSTTIGRTIRYGDPIHYGDPGLLYGNLTPVGSAPGERGQKTLLSLDASLSIQQTLEPEQGRASISTLQMSFVDIDEYMTQAISPGIIIPEILGREVKIWLGYANTSFPKDYYQVWRGRVAQTVPKVGIVNMQFVDPSIVRRQQIFNLGQSNLSIPVSTQYTITTTSVVTPQLGDIYANNSQQFSIEKITQPGGHTVLVCSGTGDPLSSGTLTFVSGNAGSPATIAFSSFTNNGNDTIVNVVGNGNFAEKILGPDGTYDTNIKCYLKIEDEFIEYQQSGSEATGFGTNQFLGVTRGARGTTPASHNIDTQVDNYVEISGHAIDIALKIMLSGWGGPYLSDQTVASFVTTLDADQPMIDGAMCLPEDTDGVRDLGIAIGDYITTTGASNGANNTTCQVLGFLDSLETSNRIILTDAAFVSEQPTSAVFSIRSQYDTLPDLCGCRMPGQEVDVAGHVYFKDTFLLDTANSYRFFLSQSDADAGKTFLENQIFLPLGAYALTRQGKISMGLTKPAIADQRTQQIDSSNVIEPQGIQVTRGLNNRKYFNEIDWTYDYDDQGNAATVRDTLDAESLDTIGVSSILPIDSKGARTDLDFDTIVANREHNIFLRYANACVLLDIKVNFAVGNLIEAGDVIVVNDGGELQIPNLSTGKRDFGIQLLEVINRTLDLKSGNVQLQLQGGIGAQVDDRYATVAPSSLLIAGSTASKIIITDSYGAIFPGFEWKKWQDYVGLKVRVHSIDFSDDEEVTFTGFDGSNKNALLLSPALSFTPAPGYILDLAEYSTSTDPNDQALVKLIHGFADPTVNVVSGADSTHFDVGAGDVAKLSEGRTILLHDVDYTNLSPEVKIVSVVGTTIEVDTPLGFTPTSSMFVELIGFADYDGSSGGPYRLI